MRNCHVVDATECVRSLESLNDIIANCYQQPITKRDTVELNIGS